MNIFATERKTISRQLLSDCARAFPKSAEKKISHHRPRNADRVDAVVLIKSRVLAADKRIHEGIRHHIETHHLAVLACQAGIVFSLIIKNDRALVHLVHFFQIKTQRPSVVTGPNDAPEEKRDDADF